MNRMRIVPHHTRKVFSSYLHLSFVPPQEMGILLASSLRPLRADSRCLVTAHGPSTFITWASECPAVSQWRGGQGGGKEAVVVHCWKGRGWLVLSGCLLPPAPPKPLVPELLCSAEVSRLRLLTRLCVIIKKICTVRPNVLCAPCRSYTWQLF